jgi:TRAP-type C4-dicarboxylate transport system permease small subunit
MSTVEDIAQEFEESAAPVSNLSRYALEDWAALAVFWVMAISVFAQFFTRYALNNSFAWTEEVASNCLVVVVFLGSAMCVRMSRHIQVDILYRFLPYGPARVASILVDLLRITFFGYMAVLAWRYLAIVADERMVSIDFPRSGLYYTVLVALVLMIIRSVQVLASNLLHGYSVLERPGTFDGIGE